ncbi:MAG: hypothetical protein CMH57_09275 [Myxococcales bacterium]|nr:hypothetical protein [Myxococcales bacterium]
MHRTRFHSTFALFVALMVAAFAVACDSSKSGSDDGKSGGKKASADGDPPKKIDFKEAAKESEGAIESVIPSPDTIFMAMSTLGKPDWKGVIKAVEKEEFDSETQTALATGIHLAQFFVHVHTKDKDEASKSIDALIRSAKQLKVDVDKKDEKEVRENIKEGKWDDLRYSLSTLNGRIQDQLIEDKKRPDLVMLISIGAWLEGAFVASKILSEGYSKKSAVVLQQGALVKDVKTSVKNTLKADDEYTKLISKSLDKLGKIMKGDDPPSKEDVGKIFEVASSARADILK